MVSSPVLPSAVRSRISSSSQPGPSGSRSPRAAQGEDPLVEGMSVASSTSPASSAKPQIAVAATAITKRANSRFAQSPIGAHQTALAMREAMCCLRSPDTLVQPSGVHRLFGPPVAVRSKEARTSLCG